ncbi:Nuclear control of ATPase protein 2 [Kickxella alabastrina]|uniref:Nuclear control of ATPase protein 2 n=1 Tax=Kickxella alabastrina TaxID=61397 RepID=A0ACC1IBB3_9FUNG|nr:Nuclear control of ATPase protein 2 [Kickxella alabastrina]
MSFVDEHYNSLLRALVANSQGLHAHTTEGGDRAESSQSSDDGGYSAKNRLSERAFDLSTQLLTVSNGGGQPAASPESSSLAIGSSHNASRAINQQQASSIGTHFAVPSLISVISDLQLVREARSEQYSSRVEEGMEFATNLVLLNSVSAIHARAIEQLLDAVLPLSVDMDYWNAQDGSAISLALYFMQSLPWRVYGWYVQSATAIFECANNPTTDKARLVDVIRKTVSARLLFPDAEISAGEGEGDDRCDDVWTSSPLLKIPRSVNILSLTRREIRHKQKQLGNAQERIATRIGMLSQSTAAGAETTDGSPVTPEKMLRQVVCILGDLSQDTTTFSADAAAAALDITHLIQLAEGLASQVQNISTQLTCQVQGYRCPCLLARSWMPVLVLAVGARYLSSYVAGHRDDFKEWLADGAVTMRNYVSQFILAPLRSAYETIRYGKHTYSVMTEESLMSDFKSLESMVVGFAGRFGNVDPAEVSRRVESGDLSDVMRIYTREMQKPFKNAVFGDLVEAMLIQVQKVKVDVGQTMAALDKLLKSNELNFLLLSTVPATLSIYAAANWISAKLSWWVSGSSRYTVSSIQATMRDIDRLLNSEISEAKGHADTRLPATTQGLLICHTHYLRHHAMLLPNSTSVGRLRTGAGWFQTLPHTRSMFLQDIGDIERASFTSVQKRNVIDRMYRTFRFL